MEETFLEFELDFFRNFFSAASEEENEFNYNIVNHQKSILSPYSIGICLYYLIAMIKSDETREIVAKELLDIDLKKFQKSKTEDDSNYQTFNQDFHPDYKNNVDSFIKEVFNLMCEVEDHRSTPSSLHSNIFNEKFSNSSDSSRLLSNNNEKYSPTKRNFFTANIVFSLLDSSLLSPDSMFFQNSNAIQHIDYIDHPVYKMINKTIKKLTLGNISSLMNPLMHFTDNSLAFSSLLYFEDNFNEKNCFDSVETSIFHTFTANSRRRRSTIMGTKTQKMQHNDSQNFCLYCQQSEPRIMTSSQSFTSLYQHSSSSVKVQMMRMIGKTPLCNDKSKNYFAVELPMSDNKFSLVCVIPRNKGEDSFSNLIQNMTNQEFHSILDNMEPMPYDILLPFFSFKTESFDLITPLAEFESHKMFLFNNSLANSEDDLRIPLTCDQPTSEKGESKKKKKGKLKKIKKKKKSKIEKDKDSSNSDNQGNDSNEISNNINGNSVDSNNNSKYFYCPHCGARQLKNNSMIGQECMLKNVKLNENAFIHHFRQKCIFSINLNGIGKKNPSNLNKSSTFYSWSSSSSISSQSSFESILDNDIDSLHEYEKDIKSKRKDKDKEKKKKDKQIKKVFDHPFIFFLTRRKPDIIIQYGVVTVPTITDDSNTYN